MLDPERMGSGSCRTLNLERVRPEHPRPPLQRGSPPRTGEQLGAGTQGLSGPLHVEGTEEPLALSIPSPLRPVSGHQPEQGLAKGHGRGGALKGTPPLLLPPAGMSRREHQALRAAEKAPGRTEELLEGRRAGTGPSLPGMPFRQGRIPGHQG